MTDKEKIEKLQEYLKFSLAIIERNSTRVPEGCNFELKLTYNMLKNSLQEEKLLNFD